MDASVLAYVVLVGAALLLLPWMVRRWVGKRGRREATAARPGAAQENWYGGSTTGGADPYAGTSADYPRAYPGVWVDDGEGPDDSGWFHAVHQQITSWGDTGTHCDSGTHGGEAHCGGSDGDCSSDGCD